MSTEHTTRVSTDEPMAAHCKAPLEAGREYKLGRFLLVRVVSQPGPAQRGDFLVLSGRQERLGRVHFDRNWQRYVFSPDYDLSFPAEYLRKLDQFLHRLENVGKLKPAVRRDEE